MHSSAVQPASVRHRKVAPIMARLISGVFVLALSDGLL
jgi:hypothetical protein